MVTLKVNGKEISVADGTLILDAAKEAGFVIPTFCYQAELSSLGSCRMCIIEIGGQKKLQPACITPVLQDMEISTETEQVEDARASMLEFLLSNHALDCPVCDKAGECELQDMVHKHGPRKGRFAEMRETFHVKDYPLSPVIVKNSNRCVQCMRCVRVCKEVVGRGVLGTIGRGAHQEETSFLKGELDCDHCGMCIEVCPVGCFMRRPYRYKSRPWDLNSTKTVCQYCATGCITKIEERDGEVIRSIASKDTEGFNGRMLCSRGRFGHDFLNNEERLTTPLLRVNGTLEPVSWDKALDVIKDKLKKSQPDRVGAVASARLTNEELYMLQKVMREGVGSSNVDASSRWSAGDSEAFIAATAIDGAGLSIDNCMEADTIFVVGSHISDENPVTDYMVRYLSASRRKTVMVASVRPMKLDRSAQITARHMPGRLGAFLAGVTLKLYEENKTKLSGVKGVKSLDGLSIDKLSKASGVAPGDIEAIAKKLSSSQSVSIMAGTDMIRLGDGTGGLCLLSDILKTLDKRVFVLPLLDRSNQRGAWDMGAHPNFGPGYSELKGDTGLDCGAMLEKASKGEMDLLYVIGDDILAMYPDRAFAEGAIEKVGFLVVQDIFLSDTGKVADLVLPGASFVEKTGTVTNQEGRVQPIKPLRKPPGKAREDLNIIADIGSMISKNGSFTGDITAETVMEDIKKDVPMYGDVECDEQGCRGFLIGGVARRSLKCISVGEEDTTELKENKKYPYYLVTGNHLFGSGTLTGSSSMLRKLIKEPTIEMCIEEAKSSGLTDGDMVTVESDGGNGKYRLQTRKKSSSKVVFIAENFNEGSVNRLYKIGERVPRVSVNKGA
ncbi:MAG: NADH-quinone oxidoreductase subunit NuoG [Deltaproteobacteria bacterium]|nr:NADH-quinone oxidoreductase subunit NuoG [Deltaproteobacteria bacterium]